MLKKIISGGQTGVDQAALKAAVECGIAVGGCCPQDGLDEEGKNISLQYSTFQKAATVNPNERTQLNIDHSDGTLILVPAIPIPKEIKDGTLFTIDYAKHTKKPLLIISLEADFNFKVIEDWIKRSNIEILNIAGPRESSWPGIYQNAYHFVTLFLNS